MPSPQICITLGRPIVGNNENRKSHDCDHLASVESISHLAGIGMGRVMLWTFFCASNLSDQRHLSAREDIYFTIKIFYVFFCRRGGGHVIHGCILRLVLLFFVSQIQHCSVCCSKVYFYCARYLTFLKFCVFLLSILYTLTLLDLPKPCNINNVQFESGTKL